MGIIFKYNLLGGFSFQSFGVSQGFSAFNTIYYNGRFLIIWTRFGHSKTTWQDFLFSEERQFELILADLT